MYCGRIRHERRNTLRRTIPVPSKASHDALNPQAAFQPRMPIAQRSPAMADTSWIDIINLQAETHCP